MKNSQHLHTPAQFVQYIAGKVHIYSHGRHWAEELAPRDLRDQARLAIASAKREQDGEPVSFGPAHNKLRDKLARNQKKFGVFN